MFVVRKLTPIINSTHDIIYFMHAKIQTLGFAYLQIDKGDRPPSCATPSLMSDNDEPLPV